MGGLFGLHLLGYSPLREAYAGTQRKNLEARTEAETMKECCVLTCSQWFMQPTLLYNQGYLPMGVTAHSELCPAILPTSIINQENAYRVAYLQSDGAFSQLKFPPPKCFKTQSQVLKHKVPPNPASTFSNRINQSKTHTHPIYICSPYPSLKIAT